MKFRQKPVVIEAEQFFALRRPWPAGVLGGEVYPNGEKAPVYIRTLKGPLRVSEGDWIITGVAGDRYPCRADIFAATYEPVDEV